jgi:hypothetical protein
MLGIWERSVQDMPILLVFLLLSIVLIAGLIGFFRFYEGMYASMYDEEKNKPPDWSKKRKK